MYKSTATAKCTLCDEIFSETCESDDPLESKLTAIEKVQLVLHNHFFAYGANHRWKVERIHRLEREDFKFYCENLVEYIDSD